MLRAGLPEADLYDLQPFPRISEAGILTL